MIDMQRADNCIEKADRLSSDAGKVPQIRRKLCVCQLFWGYDDHVW